jgi:hypothetical protein
MEIGVIVAQAARCGLKNPVGGGFVQGRFQAGQMGKLGFKSLGGVREQTGYWIVSHADLSQYHSPECMDLYCMDPEWMDLERMDKGKPLNGFRNPRRTV